MNSISEKLYSSCKSNPSFSGNKLFLSTYGVRENSVTSNSPIKNDSENSYKSQYFNTNVHPTIPPSFETKKSFNYDNIMNRNPNQRKSAFAAQHFHSLSTSSRQSGQFIQNLNMQQRDGKLLSLGNEMPNEKSTIFLSSSMKAQIIDLEKQLKQKDINTKILEAKFLDIIKDKDDQILSLENKILIDNESKIERTHARNRFNELFSCSATDKFNKSLGFKLEKGDKVKSFHENQNTISMELYLDIQKKNQKLQKQLDEIWGLYQKEKESNNLITSEIANTKQEINSAKKIQDNKLKLLNSQARDILKIIPRVLVKYENFFGQEIEEHSIFSHSENMKKIRESIKHINEFLNQGSLLDDQASQEISTIFESCFDHLLQGQTNMRNENFSLKREMKKYEETIKHHLFKIDELQYAIKCLKNREAELQEINNHLNINNQNLNNKNLEFQKLVAQLKGDYHRANAEKSELAQEKHILQHSIQELKIQIQQLEKSKFFGKDNDLNSLLPHEASSLNEFPKVARAFDKKYGDYIGGGQDFKRNSNKNSIPSGTQFIGGQTNQHLCKECERRISNCNEQGQSKYMHNSDILLASSKLGNLEVLPKEKNIEAKSGGLLKNNTLMENGKNNEIETKSNRFEQLPEKLKNVTEENEKLKVDILELKNEIDQKSIQIEVLKNEKQEKVNQYEQTLAEMATIRLQNIDIIVEIENRQNNNKLLIDKITQLTEEKIKTIQDENITNINMMSDKLKRKKEKIRNLKNELTTLSTTQKGFNSAHTPLLDENPHPVVSDPEMNTNVPSGNGNPSFHGQAEIHEHENIANKPKNKQKEKTASHFSLTTPNEKTMNSRGNSEELANVEVLKELIRDKDVQMSQKERIIQEQALKISELIDDIKKGEIIIQEYEKEIINRNKENKNLPIEKNVDHSQAISKLTEEVLLKNKEIELCIANINSVESLLNTCKSNCDQLAIQNSNFELEIRLKNEVVTTITHELNFYKDEFQKYAKLNEELSSAKDMLINEKNVIMQRIESMEEEKKKYERELLIKESINEELNKKIITLENDLSKSGGQIQNTITNQQEESLGSKNVDPNVQTSYDYANKFIDQMQVTVKNLTEQNQFLTLENKKMLNELFNKINEFNTEKQNLNSIIFQQKDEILKIDHARLFLEKQVKETQNNYEMILNNFQELQVKLNEISTNIGKNELKDSKADKKATDLQHQIEKLTTELDRCNKDSSKKMELTLDEKQKIIDEYELSMLKYEIGRRQKEFLQNISTEKTTNSLNNYLEQTSFNIDALNTEIKRLNKIINEKDTTIAQFKSVNIALEEKLHNFAKFIQNNNLSKLEKELSSNNEHEYQMKYEEFLKSLSECQSNVNIENFTCDSIQEGNYFIHKLAQQLIHNNDRLINESKENNRRPSLKIPLQSPTGNPNRLFINIGSGCDVFSSENLESPSEKVSIRSDELKINQLDSKSPQSNTRQLNQLDKIISNDEDNNNKSDWKNLVLWVISCLNDIFPSKNIHVQPYLTDDQHQNIEDSKKIVKLLLDDLEKLLSEFQKLNSHHNDNNCSENNEKTVFQNEKMDEFHYICSIFNASRVWEHKNAMQAFGNEEQQVIADHWKKNIDTLEKKVLDEVHKIRHEYSNKIFELSKLNEELKKDVENLSEETKKLNGLIDSNQTKFDEKVSIIEKEKQTLSFEKSQVQSALLKKSIDYENKIKKIKSNQLKNKKLRNYKNMIGDFEERFPNNKVISNSGGVNNSYDKFKKSASVSKETNDFEGKILELTRDLMKCNFKRTELEIELSSQQQKFDAVLKDYDKKIREMSSQIRNFKIKIHQDELMKQESAKSILSLSQKAEFLINSYQNVTDRIDTSESTVLNNSSKFDVDFITCSTQNQQKFEIEIEKLKENLALEKQAKANALLQAKNLYQQIEIHFNDISSQVTEYETTICNLKKEIEVMAAGKNALESELNLLKNQSSNFVICNNKDVNDLKCNTLNGVLHELFEFIEKNSFQTLSTILIDFKTILNKITILYKYNPKMLFCFRSEIKTITPKEEEFIITAQIENSTLLDYSNVMALLCTSVDNNNKDQIIDQRTIHLASQEKQIITFECQNSIMKNYFIKLVQDGDEEEELAPRLYFFCFK